MTAANEALSTETPATVTFDTLSAAQELRKTGFEDRQAEAVVTTISKAMNETVATKADLKLFQQSVDSRFEKVDLRFEKVDLRFEKVDLRFDTLEKSLRQEMAAQENRIVLKLGGLMVTMTFLLLAIGPFYFRWVMSLMGTS